MSNQNKTTTATENEARPVLVPKLRFPEFLGEEGWELNTLGSKATKVGSGITPSGGESNYRAIGRPFVRSQNVGWGELILNDVAFIDDETHRSFGATEIKLDDVLLNITGASIGRSTVADMRIVGGNVNQHVCIIRLEDEALVPRFLNQYLLSEYGQDQIDSFQAGGNRQGLNFAQVRSFSIPLPPRTTEQQKIGNCLTSLDNLITAQARKVDALKTHKKGLMQQLLPREGETQPRLRFPEFRDAGEWVQEELSKCIKKVIDYRGKAPPKAKSGIPLITAKNVRPGWLDMTNDEYIEKDKYEEWMSRGIPTEGDILFTTEAPLGNVALYPSLGKFALGQRLLALRPNPNKCVAPFIFYSLQGPTMQGAIDFHGTGSTAKGIKSKVLVRLSFCYPGVKEQQRIATCLTTLDSLITTENQKLETLKTHKKGLMQQLFPPPEEAEQ